MRHQPTVDESHTPKQSKPATPASRDSEEIGFQRELAALNAISLALSQTLDLDQVLELALETILWIIDSQAGFIHLPAAWQPTLLPTCRVFRKMIPIQSV
jgi:hypothetical protein